jgi:hypothetical protein
MSPIGDFANMSPIGDTFAAEGAASAGEQRFCIQPHGSDAEDVDER